MWKRDKLSRTYCARKNETQKHLIHKEFEKLRKKKSSIRKSKNECFKQFFDKNRNVERNLSAYYTKTQKESSSNILKRKDKDITNTTDSGNAFNNFLIDIGPTLSKTIPDSSKLFRIFSKLVH